MKATKVLGPLVLLLVTIWAVLYMSVDPRSLQSFSETHYRDNRGDFSDKFDNRPSLHVKRKNAETRSGKNMAVTGHNLLESTHEATKLNEINGFSETLGLKTLEKPGTSKKLFGDEAATSRASIEPSKTEQVVNMAAIFPTTPPPKKEAHAKIFQQTVAKKVVESPSGETHAGKHQVSVGDSPGQGLNSPTNTNNISDYNVGLGRELPARNPFIRRKTTRWETFSRTNSRNMKLTNNTPVTGNALKGITTTTLNERSRSDDKDSGQNSPHNVVKIDVPKTDQNIDGKDTKIKADNILNTETKPSGQFDNGQTRPFTSQCGTDRNCTIERGRHGARTKENVKPAHSKRHPYVSYSTVISTVTTGDTAVLDEVDGLIDTWEGAERNVSRAVSIVRRGHRLSRGRRQYGAHSPGLHLRAQNSNTDEKEEPTDKTTESEKRNKDSKRKRRRKQSRGRSRRKSRRRKKMGSSKRASRSRQGSKSKRRKCARFENDSKQKQQTDTNNTSLHSNDHFKGRKYDIDSKLSNFRNVDETVENGFDSNNSTIETETQTTNSTRRHSRRLATRQRRRQNSKRGRKKRRHNPSKRKGKKGQLSHAKPHRTEMFNEGQDEVAPVTSQPLHNKSTSRKQGVFGIVTNNPKEGVFQKVPQDSCPENRTADFHNSPLSERSVCPWSYYIDHDPNRIPHDIAQAKCRCTACLDPVTNKQNYNYACVPVKIKKMVLRRKKKKSGGYRYRDEWEDVAVGCTCVQPRYSP